MTELFGAGDAITRGDLVLAVMMIQAMLWTCANKIEGAIDNLRD